MIELFIVLKAISDQLFDNNSLYFDICGLKYNASYIYLDTSKIRFGVKQNSNTTHFEYNINETCNHLVPFFPTNEGILQNTAYGIFEVDDDCNMYYLYLIVSIITFLIGLIMQPDAVCKLLKKNLANQLHAGNNMSRIRTKL